MLEKIILSNFILHKHSLKQFLFLMYIMKVTPIQQKEHKHVLTHLCAYILRAMRTPVHKLLYQPDVIEIKS